MNIIFTGYYKKNNYGDDLFEQMAETIAKKYKDKIRRYKIVPISKLADKDTKPDIVILFGGEVLNDFFLKEILKLHEYNPKIIFKAIGVSCNQDYITLANKMQIFETVVFRAEKDYLYFKDILGGQCFYCPDMVFSLNLKQPMIRLHLKKTVGFFLSQTAVKPSERTLYIAEMRTYIRFWLDKDFHVKLFAMCTNNAAPTENDNLLNTDIYKVLTRVEQASVKQYKTTDVILEKFKYLDYAICWRYHAHILSILYNVPFLSLATTPKVENLLMENGLTDYSVKPSDEFNEKSLNLIENRARIKVDLKKIKDRNKKLAEFYTTSSTSDIYFSVNRSMRHYLDEKTFDCMKSIIIEKYQAQKNRLTTSQAKAQFILFSLLREIDTEYEFGLAEKITDGMSVSKLKADIGWLIAEAILHGNPMIYYLSPHKLPLSEGWLNINYINQDNYKGLHRAGWSYVVQHLRPFDNPDAMLCDLYLDRTFHWNYTALAEVKIIPYIRPWIGFIHHTLNTDYTDFNTLVLFKQPLFLSSLAYCKGIVVLTTSLKTQVEDLIKATGFLNIRVYALSHPTEFISEPMKFTLEKFKANPERKIVQVGAWMRNLNAINTLCPSTLVKKAVLKGKKMDNYYDCEAGVEMKGIICRDDKKRPLVLNSNILVLLHLENAAYDDLFRSNIVFINLIDASAVNTIIECIVRNTPIFVNRLPATEEALGVDYPLFYTDIKEVSEMLTMEKIKMGYTYLKKMDKTKFKIETFLQNLKLLILK